MIRDDEAPDRPDPHLTTATDTAVGGTADLARLRRRVRSAAALAGFRGHELDRTVLAVHEAAVLGCRLLVEAGLRLRCRLEVRTGSGSLTADVVVPGRFPVPGDPLDDRTAREPGEVTDLGPVRPFCHAVSVHDDVRTRSIRVLARTGT